MKKILAACLAVIVALLTVSAPAEAGPPRHGGGWGGHHFHGGGWRIRPSIGIGFGYGSGFYGGYPWYGPYGGFYNYPPTVITVPTEPPVYVQQPRPAPLQYQSGYWYYCDNPQGYYPYVKECLTRWQPVEPRPSVPR